MSELEDRLQSLDARFSARAAELDRRIAARMAALDAHVGERFAGADRPARPDPDGGASRSGEPCATTGTRYGLYVGINKYADPDSTLDGCVVDARNLASACRDLGGWNPANQTFLTDSGATTDAIRAALRTLADKAVAGDVVLYYQSSHGGPHFGPSSNDTLVSTHDGFIEESALREDFCRFRKGVNLIVIIDACFSGGLIRDGSGAVPQPILDMTSRIDAMVGRLYQNLRQPQPDVDRLSPDDIGWITAVDNGEFAADLGSDGGLFTSRLFIKQGWRGGRADRLGRGFVTFFDLAEYTRSESMALDRHLCPQYHNPRLLRSVVAGRTGT